MTKFIKTFFKVPQPLNPIKGDVSDSQLNAGGAILATSGNLLNLVSFSLALKIMFSNLGSISDS